MTTARKTFVVASVGNRYSGLLELINSLVPFLTGGWDIGLCLQAYTNDQVKRIDSILCKLPCRSYISTQDEMIGAHPAKVKILSEMTSDVWCSLDDDMLATLETDYDAMAYMVLSNKSIGFISGNWARNDNLAKSKIIKDELVRQPVVYTGGGLVFRDDIASIIRKIPNEQYLFDDCLWSGYAYCYGYENYRYLGSVAIHKICTSGGRISWLGENKKDKPLPPSWMFSVKRGKGSKGTQNEYLICSSSELTTLAKWMHVKYKKERERK